MCLAGLYALCTSQSGEVFLLEEGCPGALGGWRGLTSPRGFLEEQAPKGGKIR